MTERYLKSQMVLYGDDLTALAEYLQITRQTLARKMTTGTFRQDEMVKIKKRYNLSDVQFAQIFTNEGGLADESERRCAYSEQV